MRIAKVNSTPGRKGTRCLAAIVMTVPLIVGCGQAAAPLPTPPREETAARTAEGGARSPGAATGDVPSETNPPGSVTAAAAPPVGKSGPLTAEEGERAKTLYTQHCAACHGVKGDGIGVAARFMFPKPRNFRIGRFRLVSTMNGIPTIADLETVLIRGMPGSAMPPWPRLSEQDRKLLARKVVELRGDGIRDVERAMAAENNEKVNPAELEELVRDLTTPGQLVEVPTIGDPTSEALARGKQLYLTIGCAGCHGKEGRGDGQDKMLDEEGVPTRPRDLTKGIFKGSPAAESVYRRFLAGMPGTPMPAFRQNTAGQVADLTYFVLSLSDDKTRALTVLNREQIVARHLQTLPGTPDDPAWSDVQPVRLRTTPLWWRDDFEPWLEVRAAHNGDSLAFHLSWNDAEANTHAGKTESFRDAAAVELYRGDAEPFLGMGAAAAPVDVWFWTPAHPAGPRDVSDVNPNLVVDVYPFSEKRTDTAEYRRPGTRPESQPAVSLPALAVGNQNVPSAAGPLAGSLETSGPGTVTFRPPVNQSVKAAGVWKEGRWSVVLARRLSSSDKQQGIALQAGQRVSTAFAVWNGARRDRDGQKLITIWQDVVLEK